MTLYSQIKAIRQVSAQRKEIDRALDESLRYAACGDRATAEKWGLELISRLESAGVFTKDSVHVREII